MKRLVLFLILVSIAADPLAARDQAATSVPEKEEVPVYEPAPGSRDPFKWSDVLAEELAPEPEPVPEKPKRTIPSVNLEELASQLRVQLVASGREGRFAMVDGKVTRTGDKLQVKAGNRVVEIDVIGLKVTPPQIVLRYKGQTYVKGVRR